ncbi:MAG TPA: FecR family protein, partial [Bacteroidales bacterium]|nr:FecR family protein [Bacteroidales bacterium]
YKNEITVPLGSISTVRLPDGTEVILNAGSKLTYQADYGTVSREVNLTGEGYFKVHKNKNIPFIVKTLKAEIKALGTEFNVKAYPEEKITETVLVEGSVVVRKLFAGNEESQKSNETVTLKPGQKVQIYKETKESDSPKETKLLAEKTEEQTSAVEAAPQMIIQKTELEVETSWKDKEWIVKAVRLEDLAVLLSRKFNVSIEVKSPELKKYMFSGTIENETVEQVFNIMKYTIPISYSIDKGKVIWTIDHSLERDYKEAY